MTLVATSAGAAENASGVYERAKRSTVIVIPVDGKPGHGSGFVVAPGMIATNWHVVRRLDGGTVRVVGSARGVRIAGLVAHDEQRDLALLAAPGLDAPPLALSPYGGPSVGERVFALGNPAFRGTVFEGTFSDGQVTALRGADRHALASSVIAADAIQTNADLTRGSSGGPLLDVHGEVLGVTAAGVEAQPGVAVAGIGFAVPARHLLALMPQLRQGHERYEGLLRTVQARRRGLLPAGPAHELERLRQAARAVYRSEHCERVLSSPPAELDSRAISAAVDTALARYAAHDYLRRGDTAAAQAYLEALMPLATVAGRGETVAALLSEARAPLRSGTVLLLVDPLP